MTIPSASVLLFILFLVNLCWAEEVTLFLNDLRFVNTGGIKYSEQCGGSGWTTIMGDNVSVSFIGTAVTINFIAEYRGAIAQITLDGTNVTEINTYKFGVADTDCTALPWTSSALSQGNHTITVTQLGKGNDTMDSPGFVWMRSFVYTAADVSSPSSTSPPLTLVTTDATTFVTTVTALPGQPSSAPSSTDPDTLGRLMACAPCGKSQCSFTSNATSSRAIYSLMVGTPVTNCQQNANTSIKSKSGGSISIGQTWSVGGTVGFDVGALKMDASWSYSQSKSITWSQEIEIEVQPGLMGVLTANVEYQRTSGLLKIGSSNSYPMLTNQPARVISYGSEIVNCSSQFTGNASTPMNCTSNAQTWLKGSPPQLGSLIPTILTVSLMTSLFL